MANILYLIGKRILISESRERVRGTVIFLFTHLLFFIMLAFAAEIMLILLGLGGVYVPLAGKFIGWIGGIKDMLFFWVKK